MRMNDPGFILAYLHIDHDGSETYSYEWQGGRFTMVSVELLNQATDIEEGADWIRVGPYRLRKLEQDLTKAVWICVREDHLGEVLAFLFNWRRRLTVLKQRIIRTCGIWGLAGWHGSYVPGWRDIYLIDWLNRQWRDYRQFCKENAA